MGGRGEAGHLITPHILDQRIVCRGPGCVDQKRVRQGNIAPVGTAGLRAPLPPHRVVTRTRTRNHTPAPQEPSPSQLLPGPGAPLLEARPLQSLLLGARSHHHVWGSGSGRNIFLIPTHRALEHTFRPPFEKCITCPSLSGGNPNSLFKGCTPVKAAGPPRGQRLVLHLSLVMNHVFHLALASWSHNSQGRNAAPCRPRTTVPSV